MSEMIVYPAYIDATLKKSEGRYIAKRHAVPDPTIEEMIRASENLGILIEVERDKAYPRQWWKKGRLGVKKTKSKGAVLREIAEEIKKIRAQRS
ncbi:MAG: signal recognition particle subunit [Archaeoglobi archaeon]|nr:signal recognition particle subunit [Archaeoglobi archaeon]